MMDLWNIINDDVDDDDDSYKRFLHSLLNWKASHNQCTHIKEMFWRAV